MRHHTKRFSLSFRLLAAVMALGLLAAACGRDDDDGDGAAGDGDGELATGPGFDGTTITVGVVTPETGPVAIIGDPLTNGNRVYFDFINDQGGIAGQYPIEMEVVDSAYDATTAVQQYNAIKDDVVMFAQLLGTPIVSALVEQLEADNIVASPASLDSLWVREPNLFPVGGPYEIQAINALGYYVTDGGGEGQTICTAIQDDPYGEAGQRGVEFAAEQFDFEIATTARFSATDTDFTAQVAQLQNEGCEAIFLVSTPTTTGGLLGLAASQGYAPQWIGQSPTWIGALAASPLAPYLEANFLLAAEGTEWGDESVPGMAQLLEHVEQYSPDQEPDIYFVFGYYEAQSVVTLLERAVELGDLSREGIVEAMNSLDVLEFEGLSGDYQYGPPEERNPSRSSTIYAVDADAPGGLVTVERGVQTEAAEAFEFAE